MIVNSKKEHKITKPICIDVVDLNDYTINFKIIEHKIQNKKNFQLNLK